MTGFFSFVQFMAMGSRGSSRCGEKPLWPDEIFFPNTCFFWGNDPSLPDGQYRLLRDFLKTMSGLAPLCRLYTGLFWSTAVRVS